MRDIASIFPWQRGSSGAVESGSEDAPIVGRIKRSATMTKEQAVARAQGMPWWRKGLVLDSRDAKWWVWRVRV